MRVLRFVQTVGQNMPDTFSGKGVKGKDGHGKRVDVKGSPLRLK